MGIRTVGEIEDTKRLLALLKRATDPTRENYRTFRNINRIC